MKISIALILAAILISPSVHAGVELSAYPEIPEIRLRDMDENPGTDVAQVAKAPYFEVEIKVRNDQSEAIEVSSLSLTASSVEGRRVAKTFPVAKLTLAAGEEKSLGRFRLEALADSESLTYTVVSTVQYKIGDKSMSKPITLTTR